MYALWSVVVGMYIDVQYIRYMAEMCFAWCTWVSVCVSLSVLNAQRMSLSPTQNKYYTSTSRYDNQLICKVLSIEPSPV